MRLQTPLRKKGWKEKLKVVLWHEYCCYSPGVRHSIENAIETMYSNYFEGEIVMQKKLYTLMVVVTMVALVLAGCNLPASQSTAATATSSVPFPVATNDALVQNILRQTLTAAAANTTPLPTEAVSTQAMPTVVATLSQFTPVVDSTSAALTATALPTSNLLYSTATVKVAVPKSARIIIEGNSGTVGVGVCEGVGFSTENRKGEDVASKNRFPPK